MNTVMVMKSNFKIMKEGLFLFFKIFKQRPVFFSVGFLLIEALGLVESSAYKTGSEIGFLQAFSFFAAYLFKGLISIFIWSNILNMSVAIENQKWTSAIKVAIRCFLAILIYLIPIILAMLIAVLVKPIATTAVFFLLAALYYLFILPKIAFAAGQAIFLEERFFVAFKKTNKLINQKKLKSYFYALSFILFLLVAKLIDYFIMHSFFMTDLSSLICAPMVVSYLKELQTRFH